MLEQVCKYIGNYKYALAFRLLWSHSQVARNEMINLVVQSARREIVLLTRPDRDTSIEQLRGVPNMETLTEFSWKQAVLECSTKMPLVSTILEAIFPSAKQIMRKSLCGRRENRRPITLAAAQDKRTAKMGMILSMLLYQKAPKIYHFAQSVIAVEMWRQGCSGKVFKLMNTFGICQGVDAARAMADRIASDFDKSIIALKEGIQGHFGQVPSQTTRRRRLQFNKCNNSYSLGWDNVQIDSHRKHQGLDKSSKFHMWAMCFAVIHRTPTMHFTDSDVNPASHLPPVLFLPTHKDWEMLKYREVVLVQRILTAQIPALQELKGQVLSHIPHAHSDDMAKKSHVINLGTVEANPASTAGVIDIMNHLNAYVPCSSDGSHIHQLPVNGDQLSVERMTHAKRARALAGSQFDQFAGFVESPQEFHKEGILLQV